VSENVKDDVKKFPNLPGVYRMLNKAGDIIYIGKSKDLKKRVLSYFNKTQPSPRTRLMVGNIASIEFTVTNTEAEALILENNMIRSFMPRYNVIFRDDKSYPYLAITGDKYPRIRFHRGIQKKDTKYFGPFPNSNAVRQSMQLLQKVFMLRTCENSVFNNRTRPCLEHQIKRCTAPCVGLIEESEYRGDVNQANLFLDGKDSEVIGNLTKKMNEHSEVFNFERAAIFRDRIQSLRQVRLKQFVSDFSENDADIIAFAESAGKICANVVMIRGGRHLGDKTFFPKNHDGHIENSIVETFITQYYDLHKPPPVIVTEKKVSNDLVKDFFTIKQYGKVRLLSRLTGDKKNWVLMAKKNAQISLEQKNNEQASQVERLLALRALLGLPDHVNRIECYDISHTMGESTVGSCVVYDKYQMQNKDYRKYNIKNITPGDDYGAMKDVLERRFKRMAEEDAVKPDLVLIDGGKGQFGIAKKIMEDSGITDIFLVGVSKGADRKAGKEKLILSEGRVLDTVNSEDLGYHLIQHIRDESHRFAITGHRAKRAKNRMSSSLEEVEGIGAKKRKSLLVYFGGLDGVKKAPIEELMLVEGINARLAEKIFSFFH
jgi:excinuclease ABC subunit C|tara:strand:- start:686 stop:2488 length:1803 start_codon:yes stop_codon:yes gene_type:complete